MQSNSVAVDTTADECSPLLQVRIQVCYDLLHSALLINLSRTACQLYTTSTGLYAGDEIKIEHGDIEFPAASIRGVTGRIAAVGFHRPIRRPIMDHLIATASDRRWECDFAATGGFKSVRSFPFKNQDRRSRGQDDKNLIALMSGVLVRDKRRSRRKAVVLAGNCRTGFGDTARVVISDLTPEGCCIAGLNFDLTPGEKITLRPQSLEDLSATVRWVSENQAGLQFQSPLYGAVAEHIQTAHAAFLSDEQRKLLTKLAGS